jgi:hypothetical protein
MKYYYCIIVVWELLSDATGILLYYHGTTYNYQWRGNITVQYFNGSPGQAAVSSNSTSPLFSGGGGGLSYCHTGGGDLYIQPLTNENIYFENYYDEQRKFERIFSI